MVVVDVETTGRLAVAQNFLSFEIIEQQIPITGGQGSAGLLNFHPQ